VTSREQQTTDCPKCGKSVYRRAIRCPHCESSLVLDNEVRTRFVSHTVRFEGKRDRPSALIAAIVLALITGTAVLAWMFFQSAPPVEAPAKKSPPSTRPR